MSHPNPQLLYTLSGQAIIFLQIQETIKPRQLIRAFLCVNTYMEMIDQKMSTPLMSTLSSALII